MSIDPTEDPVFLQGLSAIVGPLREQGASEEEIREVTERAWQFYSRIQPAPTEESSTTEEEFIPRETASIPTASAPASGPGHPAPGAAAAEPPYPVSFSELAGLIASGAPIPGVRDIPDRLAEGLPSASSVDGASVRKPWEVAGAAGKDE